MTIADNQVFFLPKRFATDIPSRQKENSDDEVQKKEEVRLIRPENVLDVVEDECRWEVAAEGTYSKGHEKNDEGPILPQRPEAFPQSVTLIGGNLHSFMDGQHAPPAEPDHQGRIEYRNPEEFGPLPRCVRRQPQCPGHQCRGRRRHEGPGNEQSVPYGEQGRSFMVVKGDLGTQRLIGHLHYGPKQKKSKNPRTEPNGPPIGGKHTAD